MKAGGACKIAAATIRDKFLCPGRWSLWSLCFFVVFNNNHESLFIIKLQRLPKCLKEDSEKIQFQTAMQDKI